jgi:hypothetical protein
MLKSPLARLTTLGRRVQWFGMAIAHAAVSTLVQGPVLVSNVSHLNDS